jgi:hypothetical protein
MMINNQDQGVILGNYGESEKMNRIVLGQGLKCAWTVMDGVQALILKTERHPATYWPAWP